MTVPIRQKFSFDGGLMVPASAAAGRVLKSDASGNATWQVGDRSYRDLVAAHGAVAYYPLQTDANDAIGANHGTAVGSIPFGNVTGPFNDAGTDFSVAGKYVTIPVPTDLNKQWAVTLEAWVRVLVPMKGIAVKLGNASTGWGVGMGDASTADTTGDRVVGLIETREWINPTGDNARVLTNAGSPNTPTSRWTHIALIVGGSGNALHGVSVDGMVSRKVATALGPITPTGGGAIGVYPDGTTRQFQGAIAHVALYPKALSQGELCAHAGHYSHLN